MWDEITYPFPNFNGATVEVFELIGDFIPHFTGIWLLIHAGIKLIHVSKRVPRYTGPTPGQPHFIAKLYTTKPEASKTCKVAQNYPSIAHPRDYAYRSHSIMFCRVWYLKIFPCFLWLLGWHWNQFMVWRKQIRRICLKDNMKPLRNGNIPFGFNTEM